jgi:hypothetical protein
MCIALPSAVQAQEKTDENLLGIAGQFNPEQNWRALW